MSIRHIINYPYNSTNPSALARDEIKTAGEKFSASLRGKKLPQPKVQ
jgi:hypothetical protein